MFRLASRSLLLTLTTLLVLTGCGSTGPTAPQETPILPGRSPEAPAQTVTVAVWFPDQVAWEIMFPEERQLPQADPEALANAAVHELLAGPTAPYLGRAIPKRIELVEPVRVKDRVAYVNITEERWPDFNAPEFRTTEKGLIMTLTYLDGIDKVMLAVQGKELFGNPFGRPWGRFVVPDSPGREKWLAERVDKGLDPWRQDAAQVLQWDGRIFGYDVAELKAAHLELQGEIAVATNLRGAPEGVEVGPSQIILARQTTPKGKSYWVVRECKAAAGSDDLRK